MIKACSKLRIMRASRQKQSGIGADDSLGLAPWRGASENRKHKGMLYDYSPLPPLTRLVSGVAAYSPSSGG